MNPRSARILIALSFFIAPGAASAFCRATTCDPKLDCATDPVRCCILDSNGCDTNGIPLAWPTACVSYSIQENGSTLNGISATELETIVVGAFQAWEGVDCGGTKPSIVSENFGPIPCAVADYHRDAGNANIWLFRDDAWPHTPVDAGTSSVYSSALALTTVSYDNKTGEIYDADVELNSFESTFTIGDDSVGIDLASIVTHETGHFLGIDHSQEANSSMLAAYYPGTTSLRELGSDDMAAICTAYPTGRATTTDSCEPRHGFSPNCDGSTSGCSVTPGPREGGNLAFLGGLGVFLVARLRRYRAARA